jgi:HEAT repeat protein
LSDPDRFVRSFAAAALGSLGDHRASAPLLNTLMHDTDEGVRFVAAHSLGHVGYPKDPKVVSALIESLETGGLEMRANAARSLGLLKDHAAVPALQKALDDRYAGVRREAALALVRLGVNSGIDELLVALGKNSMARAEYKVIIIQALADVADQRVKAALDRIASSSDQNPAVRDAARWALVQP